jgi:Ribbon-helix-helix protein, copG family
VNASQKMATMFVEVPADDKEALRLLAEKCGVTVSALVRDAIRELIGRAPGQDLLGRLSRLEADVVLIKDQLDR